MPTYEITAPDGGTYRVNAPEGASEQDAISYVQQNHFKQTAEAKQPDASRTDRFMKGLRDPIDGGAQLLTQMLPDRLVKAGDSLNNWLADKTGLVGRLPEGGVNAQVKQQEADYQAARGPNAGFDGMRVLGNVINPANMALGSAAPAAATLAGRFGVGVGMGGASSLMNPVSGEDYWAEKAKQVGMGMAAGGTTTLATSALGRIISPNASTNPNVAMLRSEGVKPTVGQTLGGWANKAEEKAMSLPLMGDAIAASRSGANEQLNRAAFNRALAPINEKLPMNVAVGREAIQHTESALGNAYNKLLPKLTVKADDEFASQVNSLRAMVNEGALDPKYATMFDKVLNTRVLDKFQGQNAMTGETLKNAETTLGEQIRRFSSSQDPDAQLLGNAFKELQSNLRGLVQRSNPDHAKELQAINAGWANFKRVQRAASMVGAEEGSFTSAQLQNAVKAMDRSKDKGAFSRGNALMQDLSDAGKSVLGSKVPDSGTAGRVALGGIGLGSYMLDPSIPASLLTGAALYSSPLQSLLRGAVANRPESAQAVRDALLQASPRLLPGGAQVGLGLLN